MPFLFLVSPDSVADTLLQPAVREKKTRQPSLPKARPPEVLEKIKQMVADLPCFSPLPLTAKVNFFCANCANFDCNGYIYFTYLTHRLKYTRAVVFTAARPNWQWQGYGSRRHQINLKHCTGPYSIWRCLKTSFALMALVLLGKGAVWPSTPASMKQSPVSYFLTMINYMYIMMVSSLLNIFSVLKWIKWIKFK